MIVYRGFKIEEDKTGFAPDWAKFRFWHEDGDPVQFGSSIEDCKKKIDWWVDEK